MNRPGPAWLAEFQARLGGVIRTPLDRSSGMLTASPDRYDRALVDDARDGARVTGSARLAVYNRQYWFRLFDVFQTAFPLTAGLLGYWAFNDHASRFLVRVPPRGWDLEAASRGFVPFLEEDLRLDDEAERLAVVEAARIDAAWHDVLRAPATAPFRPSEADAPHLLEARLLPSEAVRVVEEHSALLALRRAVQGTDRQGGRVVPPPRLARPCTWTLVATERGVLQWPLEELEAQLFALLCTLTVRDALARLEKACRPEERERLPENARRWLARGVERGYWSGMVRRADQSQTTHE